MQHLHRPEAPIAAALALTHGAGSNCDAPLLRGLADEFAAAGVLTLRYDLAFREAGRPPHPATAARDRDSVRAAVGALRQLTDGPVFAGGHSYGGRQTSMAAAEDPELVSGLLLLSYPLHPPDKPAQTRTAHFPDLKTPSLFFHGAKDGFGTEAELRGALTAIPGGAWLEMVEGAGHELARAKALPVLVNRIVREFRLRFAALTGNPAGL